MKYYTIAIIISALLGIVLGSALRAAWTGNCQDVFIYKVCAEKK